MSDSMWVKGPDKTVSLDEKELIVLVLQIKLYSALTYIS